MANLRPIVTEEDPRLHEPSIEVKRFNDTLHELLDDMKLTMYEADGVGLAAPQVGINKQIIVVDDRENGFYEMINPKIVAQMGSELGIEFCLSVPERGGNVPRSTFVRIEYQDRNGQPQVLEARDFQARVFQHEIDHLSGTLFTDVMIEEVDAEGRPVKKHPRRIVAGRK